MPTYGRQILATTGSPVMVLADLADADWKPGGITLDWSTITAVNADTTLSDGTVIPNGQKGIEFGTILCDIGIAEVQTVTITGTPTGGTFTLSGNGNTTVAIAYNASAAVVQSAVRALGGVYAGVIVTGSAGGPYTLTYERGTGDVAQLTLGTNGLTGGTSPTVSFGTTTAGTGTGMYGPYDSAASDGRQTLARGHCFILNETVLQTGAAGLVGVASDNPAVFDGGLAWKNRLKIGGVNPASLGTGTQPTVSAFETAFPRIRYAS
jgi:hypothetical protein